MIITTSVQRGPGVQTEELIGIMSALCLFSRQDQREKPTVLSKEPQSLRVTHTLLHYYVLMQPLEVCANNQPLAQKRPQLD